MGHRSWFTFVATGRECHALVLKLDLEDMPVKGVDFVVKLNTPFEGRQWAVAWSGDGNSSRELAEPHVGETYMLEDLPLPFFDAKAYKPGKPDRFGTLFPSLEAILKASEAETSSPQGASASPRFDDPLNGIPRAVEPLRLRRPFRLSDRSFLFFQSDQVIWLRLPVIGPDDYAPSEIEQLTAPVTAEDIRAIRMEGYDPEIQLSHFDPVTAAMNFVALTLEIIPMVYTGKPTQAAYALDLVMSIGLKLWASLEDGARDSGRTGVKEFVIWNAPDGSINIGMTSNTAFLTLVQDGQLSENPVYSSTQTIHPDGGREIVTAIWRPIPKEITEGQWGKRLTDKGTESKVPINSGTPSEPLSLLPLPLRPTDRSFLFISRFYGAIWVRIPELDPTVFSQSAIAEMTRSVSWDDITSVNVEGLSQRRYLGQADPPIAAMNFICVNLMDIANDEHLHDETDLIDQVMKMSLKLWTRCEQMAWTMERLRNVKEFIVLIEPDGIPQTAYSPEPEIENRVKFGNLLKQAKWVKYEQYPDGQARPAIVVWEDVPDMFKMR